MTLCPNCNKELTDDARFCDECGTAVQKNTAVEQPAESYTPEKDVSETVVPENTVSENTVSENTVSENTAPENTVPEKKAPKKKAPKKKAPKKDAPKKKAPKKAIIFGAVGAVVLAVLVAVIFLILGGKENGKANYAVYFKDREVFFSDLKKDSEPWQITSQFIDSKDDSVSNEMFAVDGKYVLGLYTHVSENGKYVFFVDKMDGDNNSASFYYRATDDPEAKAIKIDSDVTYYSVSKDGTIVTYLTKDGMLYQYSTKDEAKEKIASDVQSFTVSETGEDVCFINLEQNLYLKSSGKDREKIAGEIKQLRYVSGDCSTVYYTKDSSIYKYVKGGEAEEIVSDVYDVVRIYDSGEIYYIKDDAKEVAAIDLITDDKQAEDAKIKEPDYPDYPDYPDRPYWWDYDTDAEYEKAYEKYEKAYEKYEKEYDRLYEEYYAAYELYWEKEDREELREYLAEEKIEQHNFTLCFFDGTKETVVAENVLEGDPYEYTTANNVPVISYEVLNNSKYEKVKLSEIESEYDINWMLRKAKEKCAETCVAIKETATVIEEQIVNHLVINPDGTDIYYIIKESEDGNTGELRYVSVSGGKIGTPEAYDTDVYMYDGRFINNNDYLYFKEYKEEGKGEMYINKKLVDYDVPSYQIYISDEKVYYLADWNDEKSNGSLKYYSGGESVKISDDVHDFEISPEGQVLYLYDYSTNYYRGELYMWSNGEAEKIDDDVICIGTYYNSTVKGTYYY